MKWILLIGLVLGSNLLAQAQCSDQFEKRLRALAGRPYLIQHRQSIELGDSDSSLMVSTLFMHRQKYKLIFEIDRLDQPIQVSIMSLNRYVHRSATLTREINYVTFIPLKTEKYYITFSTRNSEKSYTRICVGIVIGVRDRHSKAERIKWKKK